MYIKGRILEVLTVKEKFVEQSAREKMQLDSRVSNMERNFHR